MITIKFQGKEETCLFFLLYLVEKQNGVRQSNIEMTVGVFRQLSILKLSQFNKAGYKCLRNLVSSN